MKSFEKKDSLLKNREDALKRNLKKRKKIKKKKRKKCQYFQISGLKRSQKKKE